MLALSLGLNQYLTINNDIVVTVARLSGSRCSLLIDADRSIPIVRGEVLERGGNPPPPFMEHYVPLKKPKRRKYASVPWDRDREQAARILEEIACRLENKGDAEEAGILRAQLRQIEPAAKDEN